MKLSTVLTPALLFCALLPSLAEYSVSDHGDWPKSWPKQLDPLRKTAHTFVGPMVEYQWYAIPFSTREQFQSAWPYLLKVKSKGAPVFLVNSGNFFLGEGVKSGVVVHTPPAPQPGRRAEVAATKCGGDDLRSQWMNTGIDIEVVADGAVIDANKLHIPKGTPLVDERHTTADR